MLNLKNTILLILLFYLLTLSAISLIGYSYLQDFADKSRTIKDDNYASVLYASSMQVHLNQIHQFHSQSILAKSEQGIKVFKPTKAYQKARLNFSNELSAAQKNITEVAEASLLKGLETSYQAYLKAFSQSFNAKTATMEEDISRSVRSFFPLYQELRQTIQTLHNLNMNAIQARSSSIQESGDKISFYIGLFGMFSIVITLIFIFILPNYLADPISELNQKIQEIGEQNYEPKLELKNRFRGEVAELARSFNTMASRIRHYEESSLQEVWLEKKRTETVIENLPSAIIVLDENQKLLYANQHAQKLVDTPANTWLGVHASKAMDQGDKLKNILNALMISDVGESPNEKRFDTIKLSKEDKEIDFKRSTIDMYSLPESEKQQPELVGYLIILERMLA